MSNNNNIIVNILLTCNIMVLHLSLDVEILSRYGDLIIS